MTSMIILDFIKIYVFIIKKSFTVFAQKREKKRNIQRESKRKIERMIERE